jgi:hypothetical protein
VKPDNSRLVAEIHTAVRTRIWSAAADKSQRAIGNF